MQHVLDSRTRSNHSVTFGDSFQEKRGIGIGIRLTERWHLILLSDSLVVRRLWITVIRMSMEYGLADRISRQTYTGYDPTKALWNSIRPLASYMN